LCLIAQEMTTRLGSCKGGAFPNTIYLSFVDWQGRLLWFSQTITLLCWASYKPSFLCGPLRKQQHRLYCPTWNFQQTRLQIDFEGLNRRPTGLWIFLEWWIRLQCLVSCKHRLAVYYSGFCRSFLCKEIYYHVTKSEADTCSWTGFWRLLELMGPHPKCNKKLPPSNAPQRCLSRRQRHIWRATLCSCILAESAAIE